MPLRAEDVLRELASRGAQHAGGLLDEGFPAQTAFVRDPAPLKAAFCTRRAGKSYGIGLYLFQEALENPGCTVVYAALTRESAKRIMWKDVLKAISKKHRLRARFQETELAIYLPNGSVIYVVGMDVDENQKAKLLGQKYRLAVVDEAGQFGTDLKELIYGVLKPAVADYNGTVCLIGTPSNFTRGLFYDVAQGREPGWSVHRWGAMDNPHIKKQWQKEIADIRRDRPLFMETNLFKQHYLGQWVIDTDKLVYRFRRERNTYRSLPTYPQGSWTHVLGVDMGYNDASAFVVGAYHDHDPCLYVVDCHAERGMDVTAVANKIKWLTGEYGVSQVIVDGANKQAVMEMQNRHGLSLKPADKTGKPDFIELMNAELTQGKVRLQEERLEPLVKEWGELIWDESRSERAEKSGCENHLSDACLYMWRFCYPYLNTELKVEPRAGTPQWYEKVRKLQNDPDTMAREMEEALQAQRPLTVREGLPSSEEMDPWLMP